MNIEEILSNTIQKCQSMEHGCVAPCVDDCGIIEQAKNQIQAHYKQRLMEKLKPLSKCLDEALRGEHLDKVPNHNDNGLDMCPDIEFIKKRIEQAESFVDSLLKEQ